MDKDEMFVALENHRYALCDQLETLTPEQWDAQSLCAGWRVHEVLGHLVSIQDVPTYKFLLGGIGMAGFHRQTTKFAHEFAQRPPLELVERYRETAAGRVAPPFVGPIAPLIDVLLHSLDIQRPLGLPAVHTEAAVRQVLTALCAGQATFTSKKLVEGLRFEATDIEWTKGDGLKVQGASTDLMLAVMGRSEAAEVAGAGVSVLAQRI